MKKMEHKKPKVSIIILNWDGEKFLDECLNAIYDQTYKDFEVVFVDNGSKDNSVKFLREHFPKVKIIINEKNEGFARGNNIGMEASKGEYIILLNNDTHVFKDWLEVLVNTADSHPEAAVVGSLNLNYGTEICQSWGNKINFFNNFIMFNKYIGRGKKASNSLFKENREVEYVLGCSMLIKRKVLEEIGLIDELYFSYHEELDWQYRMGLKGYKIITSPAKLWHYGSQSSKESWHKIYLIQRNKLVFIRKQMKGALKYWNLCFTQPIHFLLILPLVLFKGNFKATIKGFYEAVKWHFENKELKSEIPKL